MGPITLFDKSFLQSLSLDESVWFDHFFLTNVCPVFYVETLADLEKFGKKGRASAQQVSIIADKFPEMGSFPCTNHIDLCIGNLFGYQVPMTGQIPSSHGRLVKFGGKVGLVSAISPEADAFSRWQKRRFLQIERLYARVWRKALSTLDLDEVASGLRSLGIDGKSCKSMEHAKALGESVVSGRDRPLDRMSLAFAFLNIPRKDRPPILERWSTAHYPALTDYAPYAAFVLTVEIFFQIALAANLISSKRPSNRVDIAYLFYLPFCMMFVSSDKLHRKCAPLFLRSNQEFVWGPSLKEDLSQLNAYYLRLPDSEKERGMMSFADDPPQDGDFLVAQLWDRHLPKWRQRKNTALPTKTPDQSKILEKIEEMAQAPSFQRDEDDFSPLNLDSVTIKRQIRKVKGSWYQIPKDLSPE